MADGVNYFVARSPEQFRWAVANQKNVKLASDIDLAGFNWSPVAVTTNFIIDGGGHTIYNMRVQGQGMISTVNNGLTGFTVRNLRFRYSRVDGAQQGVGTLAGTFFSGRVENVGVEDSLVHNTGNHTGGLLTGWDGSGTVGSPRTVIDKCYAKNVYTYGSYCVGNFIGPIPGAQVTNSYAVDGAAVSTGGHSGGLISCPGYCTVKNCFTNITMYGNITTGNFMGVPHYNNVFENCYSAGVVEGTNGIGGFMGARDSPSGSTFTNCYTTSMVGMMNGGANMGGFAGNNNVAYSSGSETFTNCYAAGEVGSIDTLPVNSSNVRGFVGVSNAAVTNNCYYDKQTTAMRENGGATAAGLLTKEFMGTLPAGFDANVWEVKPGMYPQLKVFSQADDTFGDQKAVVTAKAYSKASACTALLAPSNDPDATTSEYDTVRDIQFLFPLTNNELAGNETDVDIRWRARDIKSSLPSMSDIPVITLNEQTYSVDSLAPGIGWVDVAVSYTEGDMTVVGKRSMRLVPTTTISVASATGTNKVIYVGIDDHDTYDHRIDVNFSKGTATQLQGAVPAIATQPYPAAGDFKADLDTVGGYVQTLISKLDEQGNETPIDLSDPGNSEFLKLFTGERQAEESDLGVYQCTYRWYASGDGGSYIENSKKLTVRKPLVVRYEYNDGIHLDDQALYYQDPSLHMIGDTAGMPPAPERTGHTLAGWSTAADADYQNFSASAFTDQTKLKDDTTVYAVWKPNPYNITTLKVGNGVITPSSVHNYGTDATVEWTAKEGYTVSRVLVDGQVRDDLIAAGTLSFTEIDADHTVFVEFTKDGEGDTPGSEDYYTITTERIGAPENMLSDSAVVKKGDNYEVSWHAAPGYTVKSVEVDGIARTPEDEGSVSFQHIAADHTLKVVFVKDGSDIQPVPNGGFLTITTEKDGAGTISQSASLKKGDAYTASWAPEPGWHVTEILIDGQSRSDLIGQSSYLFDDDGSGGVTKDHTIKVTFTADSGASGPDNTNYRVNTAIIGGPGVITGSAVVAPNEDYTVAWTASENNNRYLVQEVEVNGQPKPELVNAQGQVELTDISEDQQVVVKLEPNLMQIVTSKEGEGTIDPSKTVFYGDDYQVGWLPAEGWELASVEVDGASPLARTLPDNHEFTNITDNHKVHVVFTRSGGGGSVQDPIDVVTSIEGGSGTITPNQTGLAAGSIAFNRLDGNHHVIVLIDDQGVPAPGEDGLYHIDTIHSGGGSISDSLVVKPGTDHTITWSAEPGCRVEQVIVDGVARPDLVHAGEIAFSAVSRDHRVEVVFVKEDGSAPADTTHQIDTVISGGAGEITASGAIKDGADAVINWKPEAGYHVATVVVDGVVRDDLLGADGITLDQVRHDHTVVVGFGEGDSPAKPGEQDENLLHIDVSQEGPGQTSGSVIIQKGKDHTVTWKPADGYIVGQVIVDGVRVDALKDAGEVAFADVARDHTVKVIFEPAPGTDPFTGDYYRVDTSISGGLGTISGGVLLPAGSDHTVKWQAGAGYTVVKVYVDGIERTDLLDAGEITFQDLAANHSVQIVLGTINPDSGIVSTGDTGMIAPLIALFVLGLSGAAVLWRKKRNRKNG